MQIELGNMEEGAMLQAATGNSTATAEASVRDEMSVYSVEEIVRG